VKFLSSSREKPTDNIMPVILKATKMYPFYYFFFFCRGDILDDGVVNIECGASPRE
jgi:hypothetical protein